MASFLNTMETVVAPTIGVILSTLTFSAPITSLRSAVQAGSLGDLNPTPWAFMLGNTVGWIAYSFITGDMYVFFANVFGLIFSIYLNIGAMKLQYYDDVRRSSPSIQLVVADALETNAEQNERDNGDNPPTNGMENSGSDELKTSNLRSFTTHEVKVLMVIIIWVLILSITSLASEKRESMEKVVGISVNINLMLFYGGRFMHCFTLYYFMLLICHVTNDTPFSIAHLQLPYQQYLLSFDRKVLQPYTSGLW